MVSNPLNPFKFAETWSYKNYTSSVFGKHFSFIDKPVVEFLMNRAYTI